MTLMLRTVMQDGLATQVEISNGGKYIVFDREDSEALLEQLEYLLQRQTRNGQKKENPGLYSQ